MSFEKIDPTYTKPNLEGTMSGQNVTPSATDQDIAPYDKAITEAESRLTAILGEYPDVDYNAKYKEILGQVAGRPVPETQNSLLQAAYTMGSPQNAPTLLHHQVMRKHEVEDQKQADLMKLQESLLQGSIQAELAKGNFKLALSQSEKLGELQRAVGDRERALNLKDWKSKQGMKTADAATLIRKRVNAIASSFHLDEKMKLALFNHMNKMAEIKLGSKNVIGNPNFEDADITDAIDDIMPEAYDWLKGIQSGNMKPETKPQQPTSDLNSRASALLEKLRAGKKGKK